MKTIIYFKEKVEKDGFNSIITKSREAYINIDHIVIESRTSKDGNKHKYIMLFSACNSLINEFNLDENIDEVRIMRFFNFVQ